MTPKNKQSGPKSKTAQGRDRRSLAPLLGIAILLVALWAFAPLRGRRAQEAEFRRLSHDHSSLKNENARLKSEIRKLKHSPAYIETMARKDLGLIKSDEEAYTVIESTAAAIERPRAKPRPEPGLWERLASGLSGLVGR